MILQPEEARQVLLTAARLGAVWPERRAPALRSLLGALRMIQLDPLDAIGTNAELVAAARVDGLRRREVYGLLRGAAFEHFAKERCLLPAHAFPVWRDRARQTPWWRLTERLKRLGPELVEDVYAEVAERGPVTVAELADRGRVRQLDWSGWKGTGKAATMAMEVLWTRCRVVVCGRTASGAKRYDVPERALPEHAAAPAPERADRWALLERVEAAGLLARAGGPLWGGLMHVRKTLPDQLVAEGVLEDVVVAGSSRRYLAPVGFRDRPAPEEDGRVRILAPLDPVLWDRKLVAQAFGFTYVWEVYKPKTRRQWGWYVCPLLHRGQLVGRIEAERAEGTVRLKRLWVEEGRKVDRRALGVALRRLGRAVC